MNTSEQPTDTVTDPTQDPDVISGPASHVFAHRGASGEAFEHTFASYDLAIAAGSLFIEQDLVSSAEGTLYIAHDKSPESLTGEKRPFSELTDAEIDALTLPDGSSFLKLKDLFTRYGSEIHYVIELRGPSQLTPLLDMIREFQLEDKVILQSWAFAILHDIEQQMPEAGRLFLTQTQEGLEKALVQPYVQIIAVPTALMTPENCVLVHDAGKRFCVFALNTPTEIRWAILMGVDLYFTDFPANALRLEEEYRK